MTLPLVEHPQRAVDPLGEFDEYVTAIPAPNLASGLLIAGRLLWYGAMLSNNSTTLGFVYDGQDATGTLLGTFQWSSTGQVNLWFGPNGILVRSGLFVHMSTGNPAGAFFWRGVRGRKAPAAGG